MDKMLIETLKKELPKDLLNYEIRIRETDEHYDELAAYGRYSTEAPYGLKHVIPFWIHLLEEGGVNCENFRVEYKRITQKLVALEKKRGRDYREKLFSNLKQFVGGYPGMIDNFVDMEPLEFEIPQSLAIRSSIEILLMELERDYDLTEIKAKVSPLDKEFRSKYLQNVDEILEHYPEAEDPYSPESFWWNHPLKLLKEKQAMQNNS
ncbi:hypothetical protein [uncultured Methanofollis sp.]|uniref:hypothetical protein n=1 Tax=uncultured Methanofollis sp. TaxID=262500 RepID=UPI0026020F6B|nr:hypothetical protein [uncultured Methanofollis sp.]